MKTIYYLSILLILASCQPKQAELLPGFDDLLVPALSTHIRSFEAKEVEGQAIKLRETPNNQLRRDFDEQGYLTRILTEDESGQTSTQTFRFDSDYRLYEYVQEYPHYSIHLEQEARDINRARFRFERRQAGQLQRSDTFYEEKQDGLHILATQAGVPIQKVYRNKLRQITEFDRFDPNNGQLSARHVYVYEDKQLISEAQYQGDSTLVATYSYTQFDEQGNWTQRIKKLDGEVVAIEERSIRYPPAPSSN